MKFALCNSRVLREVSGPKQKTMTCSLKTESKLVPHCLRRMLGGECAVSMESPRDVKKRQKSRGHVEAREVRPGVDIWLKKSVQAQSLEDHLDLEVCRRGSTISPPLSPLDEGRERPRSICEPSVASNGRATIGRGEQPVRAVQVGRNPPASWYLAGGIRIGVQHFKPCLAAKHGLGERSDPDVTTQEFRRAWFDLFSS